VTRRFAIRGASRALALATLLLLACSAPAAAGKRPARNEPASPVAGDVLSNRARKHALAGLDGSKLTLAGLEGQVVVLNFWASWCAPCRRELPDLDALDREIEARGGRVIAVSIDEDVENARRFARVHQLTMPVVHDGPDGLVAQMNLDHVPYTLVIDRRGKVVYTAAGAGPEVVDRVAAITRKLVAADPGSVASEGR